MIEESNTPELREELQGIYDRVWAILVELDEMKARVSEIASMGPAQSGVPLTFRLVLPSLAVMALDDAAKAIGTAKEELQASMTQED